MIVSLETKGTNAYNPYTMCPAGHTAESEQATPVDSIMDVVRYESTLTAAFKWIKRKFKFIISIKFNKSFVVS